MYEGWLLTRISFKLITRRLNFSVFIRNRRHQSQSLSLQYSSLSVHISCTAKSLKTVHYYEKEYRSKLNSVFSHKCSLLYKSVNRKTSESSIIQLDQSAFTFERFHYIFSTQFYIHFASLVFQLRPAFPNVSTTPT